MDARSGAGDERYDKGVRGRVCWVGVCGRVGLLYTASYQHRSCHCCVLAWKDTPGECLPVAWFETLSHLLFGYIYVKSTGLRFEKYMRH